MPEFIDSPVTARFEVDEAKRQIKGLAVPYGPVAMSNGKPFTFSKGSIQIPEQVSRVKVLVSHDFSRAVGVATALEETDEGLWITARIAKGPAGDEALTMAAEGVWDGLSIGVGQGGKYKPTGDVFAAVSVPLAEVSITPMPSFSDARITDVAASAAPNTQQEVSLMGDENINVAPVEAPDFSAVTDAIKQGFEALAEKHAKPKPVMPVREVIPAGEGVQREELPYRFDGTAGAHGFLADIRDQKFAGNADAAIRLERFLAEAFANITTGNVAGLNPAPTRPELYVDNLHFGRPLWNLVTQGTLTDATAFIIPKFNTASGLVGDHTQGTEPTGGSLTATTQTVTPSALSGRADLNREVVDQGGNPKVDMIVWNEMVSGYYDNLEQAIATALATGTGTEINLGAGADDGAKIKLLTQALAGLQFVKGGDRFSAFAGDPTLYGLVTAAVDTTGRPLFPTYGPMNADGSKAPSLESVQVGAKRLVPAWALDKAVANSEVSYLFVPQSVYAWVSAPRRIDIEFQVSSVSVGIFGYKAAAVTRTSDVIPVDATTADV